MKAGKIIGRSYAAELAKEAMSTRKAVRTGYYTGSGRWTKATDNTGEVVRLIEASGRRAITGNDAPRGGVLGQWVRVATKAERMAIRGREINGAASREADLILRAHQVERHASLRPVPFRCEDGDIVPHARIIGTEREPDYAGAGPITMYVDKDGHLAAFHYGYAMPDGWSAPMGLTARRGTASCGEACYY